MNDLNLDENDLPYEEDIYRNPYSIKSWVRYIDHKASSKPKFLFSVYERGVERLPYSYKLWYNYLKVLRIFCRKLAPDNPMFEDTNNAHERALITMHKMPRIWIDYLTFLKDQMYVNRFRRTFNRALLSLPTTQHKRLWKVVLEFIKIHKIKYKEICLRMYRRYMMSCPEDAEDYVTFLLELKRFDEAGLALVNILNNEKFTSRYSKPKFELWMNLCDIITKNPNEIHSVEVNAIIRQGISKYKDQVGLLWCALADYYIRSKNFEYAKNVYEEALDYIDTVEDFKQIFQAYSDFFQEIIKKKIELLSESNDSDLRTSIDLELSKNEYLLERRALLLNSVVLKQNPFNIENWLERVKLLEPHGCKDQLECLEEAISKVGVAGATVGRVSQLWIEMGRLHEAAKEPDQARTVFMRAATEPFSKTEDLADVYRAAAELEVRQHRLEAALTLLRQATREPAIRPTTSTSTAADKVHKSRPVWCFLVDLTERLCSVQETEHAYENMIELRIATPNIILNYADFLERHNYFEKSFRVYQKGVSVFKWPQVHELWLHYLTKFVSYYQSEHYQRTVDLFESCLEHCPGQHSRQFFLLYARFVEQHGLNKRALGIYERATRAADKPDRLQMVQLYLEKVKQWRGVMQTRPVFELGVELLMDCATGDSITLCVQYAEMERQLGEVDRARAIYSHCSQLCDPRLTQHQFWDLWQTFEAEYGNTETLEVLNQVKRSVEARYNTNQKIVGVIGGEAGAAGDSMQQLQDEANGDNVDENTLPSLRPGGISFVSGGSTMPPSVADDVNPEAMDIGEDEEDDDDDEPVQLPLPIELGVEDD